MSVISHIHVHAHMYIYMYNMYVNIQVHLYMYMYMYIYTCMKVDCIYTCIHVHTVHSHPPAVQQSVQTGVHSSSGRLAQNQAEPGSHSDTPQTQADLPEIKFHLCTCTFTKKLTLRILKWCFMHTWHVYTCTCMYVWLCMYILYMLYILYYMYMYNTGFWGPEDEAITSISLFTYMYMYM